MLGTRLWARLSELYRLYQVVPRWYRFTFTPERRWGAVRATPSLVWLYQYHLLGVGTGTEGAVVSHSDERFWSAKIGHTAVMFNFDMPGDVTSISAQP